MEKSVTYYDQRHRTGADIDQAPSAKAILTFSNQTTRDMTQTAMRMRDLLTSQTIEIVIPKELEKLFGSHKPTFDQLLSYSIVQQANRLADDMCRSTKMKISQILRNNIELMRKKEGNYENKALITAFFEDILTDIHVDNPFLEFGIPLHLDDTITVFNEFLLKQKDLVQKAFSDDAVKQKLPMVDLSLLMEAKQAILSELATFQMPDKNLVPNQIPHENLTGMIKETKVEVQKEVELEVNNTENKTKFNPLAQTFWQSVPNDPLFFTPDRTDLLGLVSPKISLFNKLLEKSPALLKFQGLFDPDLCATELFHQTVVDQPFPILGKDTQKSVYQMVFVVDPDGSSRGILMDQAEAGKIREFLAIDAIPERKIILKDLRSPFFSNKGPELTPQEQDKMNRLIAQTKFLNGELRYTKKEKRLLKNWLAEHPIPLMKELFEHILSIHSGKEADYPNSWLHALAFGVRRFIAYASSLST